MAASALKMTAVSAMLVILLSAAAQPAMAGGLSDPFASDLAGLQLFSLAGGLAYFLPSGKLVYILSDVQCTKDKTVCINICRPPCRVFGEQVLCNKIICNQAIKSCYVNVDYTCDDVCAKFCGVIKSN